MEKPDLEDLRQFVKLHPFPTDVLIETIAGCDLKCIMCPVGQLTRKKGKMSFDLWKKIIDEIAEKSPSTKIWPALMGEPLLLRQEIFKMISYAKEQGIHHVALSSNLQVFHRNMIEDLLNSGLDELVISIDAITPETYAKIRVGGNLETLFKNIHFILDEKAKRGLSHPKITLQYIVMEENENEEQPFIDYWIEQGKDVKLKVKPKLGWCSGVDPWDGIVNVAQEDRDLPCTWLLRQMTIFWNGHVPQCDGDWNGNTHIGDMNTETIEDIWNNSHRLIRERHMKLDFDFDPCRKCVDWQAGRSIIIDCGKISDQAVTGSTNIK